MDIHIVIRDLADGGMSQVIGAYSTGENAKAAIRELGPSDDSYDTVVVELDWKARHGKTGRPGI